MPLEVINRMIYKVNLEAILDVANGYRTGEKRPAQKDSVRNNWKDQSFGLVCQDSPGS